MAGVAAAAPEALALAVSSVTMLWGGVLPLPAPPPRMLCHVSVIRAFADHCMPSVSVLGGFPYGGWPGQRLSTAKKGSAMPPCLAAFVGLMAALAAGTLRTTAPRGFSICTAKGTSAQLVASSGCTKVAISCGARQSGNGASGSSQSALWTTKYSSRQRQFAPSRPAHTGLAVP